MATHKGSEGLVKIGSNTIAEVTSFTIDHTADMIEDTELSDTDKTFIADKNSWTASIEAHWDETDSTGQGAMTVGASVTLNLYPEGDTGGDTYFTGTALITSISRGNAEGSTVTAAFSLQGTGTLTTTTV